MRSKLILVLILLSLNMVFVNSDDHAVPYQELENNVSSDHNKISTNPPSPNIQQTIRPSIDVVEESVDSTTPTVSKRSYSSKPIAGIGTDATTQDYTSDYDQQVIITGVLRDGVGTLWTFTQVDLIIDAVPTQIVDTDGSGVYTFTLNFFYADIGNHNYIVNFTNAENDEFRVPGIIKSGNIDLFDIVTPAITTDKVTVGLLQTFTISYKLVNDIGGDIDANSIDGLSTDFTITSSDPSHSSPQIGTNTSVTFTAGFAKITYTAPFASNDYILSISVVINSASTSDPSYSHINFANAPASINVNVAALLVFTYSATIGGSAIDSNSFYTRGGATDIQILGSIDDPNAIGLGVDNRAYTISVSGGGSGIADTNDVTNGFGDFTFTQAYSIADFTDPNEDIVITITFADANIQPQSDTINIKIAGIFGSFASTSSTPAATGGQITDFMFWPNGENTIAVSGNVLDADGVGVIGIDVDINLNTKSAINDPWAGIINEQINTRTTGAGGAFSHTITIPDIGYNIAWLTINFTLSPTDKWTQPGADVTVELLSFMYFRSITITVTQDSEGATAVNTGLKTFDVLNDTYDAYTLGIAKYDITFIDDQTRTPLGVTYDATITQYNALGSIIGTSTTQLDATAGNSATFQIPFSDFRLLTDYNIHILNDATKYSVTIIIADRNTNLPVSTYTEEFILFGPDDVDPTILSINVGGASTGVEDNITIITFLDYTKSALDNIRSVTLYYWLSDNQVDQSGDAIFTGDYTSVLMNYYPVLFNYNYTILFDDHGTWVRWYVEVLDKAGQGLLLNGNTQTAGTYGWDDTFSNVGYFNGKNSVTPNLDKMGDTDIVQIDLTTAVRVNGDLLLDSSNVTVGDLILVSIDLPKDPSLYSDIAIWYRVRTYDPDTGEVISSSAYQRLNLTFDVDLGVALRYFHLFNTTDLGMDWFTQLDYYFDYTDVPGNNHVTQAISTLFDADPEDVKETWVNDEIAPTGEFNQTLFEENLINDTKIGVNEYEIYNDTESVYVSYNVTDIGSGIKHVNVTIFLYTTLGNGTVIYTPYRTFTMVIDGVIQDASVLQLNEDVGTYYYVEFEIPVELFASNNNVTWTIYVVDKANTITTLNDKDGVDPVQLIIVDSPVIITPTDDIVDLTTSDITLDNGSVVQTIVPVEEGTSATWIVLGFIIGIAVLIAYYQRHNIGEVLDRRRRKNQAEGTLRDLMDEIYRLGAEGKYKRAILLSWEALERVTREIIQTPRKYFQTAREFTDFLSTVTIVERETLLTLSSAFEAARYGKDKPSSDDLDDAVNALKIIVDTIIQSGARVKFDEDDDF